MKNIRALQLIDSLDVGGGEQMAVNIANGLYKQIKLSAIVSTRHSGILKKEIIQDVQYLCLAKKHTFDLKALRQLRTFVVANRIKIIHAHSTSFFMASMLKLTMPRLKLVWHDHYGMGEELSKRPVNVIKFCSVFFSQIISVNEKLKDWAKQNLCCDKVVYIQNFSTLMTNKDKQPKTLLRSNNNDFKIIHLANLRPQKDHLSALRAIDILIKKGFAVSYHIVGQYDDTSTYFKQINTFIEENDLSDSVTIYGEQTDVSGLLQQADMGILSSISEGLPLSLIEYAIAKLPIVVTDVGQCKEVVEKFAKVVKPQDTSGLIKAIISVIENLNQAKQDANNLYEKIQKEFSSDIVIKKIIACYKNL